ncbi:hypothetical protein OA88_06615 [Flavobacterium sp. JRM]|nr:hypothetical protein OA88_06615 [Flavobacterium sp. JRM]
MSGNNSGLIRNLKKIDKNLNQEPKQILEKQNRDYTSFFISILALFISIASIYLQFFYESYQLKASLVDSFVTKNSISLNLIYTNKGNQDATIINSEIFFYSDRNENKQDLHIQFVNNQNDNIPAFVLSSGKQIFHKFNQEVYFDEEGLLDLRKTNTRDTLRVNLRINYINESALKSDTIIRCGWITLDSLNKIEYYSIDYRNFNLNSNKNFSKGYNYELSTPKRAPTIKDSIIEALK